MSCWIADASPLIFLAKLDQLALLRQSADEIVVPSTVLQEVLARQDIAARRVREACETWLHVRSCQGPQGARPREDRHFLGELDPGEAAVLALALEMGVQRVVLDDLAARRFARRHGLSSIGTLGILLAARFRGDLPALRPEIQRLREYGFRASEALVDAVLLAAGEGKGVH